MNKCNQKHNDMKPKGIGCPILDKTKCPYLCTVLERPSRCLKYDDANQCSKANTHKKKMRRHQKKMIERGALSYMWML